VLAPLVSNKGGENLDTLRFRQSILYILETCEIVTLLYHKWKVWYEQGASRVLLEKTQGELVQ
jgi:hypothetical protein